MNRRATSTAPVHDSFVEDDYEPPQQGGKYFRPSKLPEGQTRIRILARPVKGSRGWKDNSPVHKRMGEQFEDGEVELSATQKIQHFWAMPVWNYSAGAVQLAEITQATIQTKLVELSRNTKWGSPLGYDVCISKKGSGMDTEYDVIPEPKEALEEGAQAAWEEIAKTFDLERLFSGGDPFEGEAANGNGNGNGQKSTPEMRRAFAILEKCIDAGLYDKSIKAKTDAGKDERRKLYKEALGRSVEPEKMTEGDWSKVASFLDGVLAVNQPPAGVDDDIPF